MTRKESNSSKRLREAKLFRIFLILGTLVLVENAFLGVIQSRFNPVSELCFMDCEKETPRLIRMHNRNNSGNEASVTPAQRAVLPAKSEQVTTRNLVVPHYSYELTETTKKAMKDYNILACFQHGCNASSESVWAYNVWSKNVYLCGQTISPNSQTELAGGCQEFPRVYKEEPTIRGTQSTNDLINVIQSQSIPSQPKRNYRSILHNCTVPCRFVDIGGTPISLTVEGTNWRIFHSLESPSHYPTTAVRTNAWKEETFYSTTSFRSEIPLPYFWLDVKINSAPVSYDKAIKGSSFIASNCGNTKNDRLEVVAQLMKTTRVDSFGICLHNAEPPEGVDIKNKEGLQKGYLFHLAFENSNVQDHITEKLWWTLKSGTLPVYMGAPNIKEHAPEHSIISWHDFNSTRELGEYLNVVASNKSLYESYHAWRFQPTLPDRFLRKYNFTNTHAACRTCKWAYAKQRGLGWDHRQQEMRPLSRSRQLCFNSDNLIVQPFQEITSATSEEKSRSSVSHCHEGRLPNVATLGNWTRTVSYQDGVVDLYLDGTSSAAYRLSTGMVATGKKLQPNLYQIQNEVSRISFAVGKTVQVLFTGAGLVDFQMNDTSGTTQRIRVITEDVSTFYEGEDMSYYGKLMVDQFENPPQFFKAGPNNSAAS